MPTWGIASPIESDPRRWQRCLEAVARDMVAAGWPPKARKFHEVQHRRARRMFATAWRNS
jgi:hypothetical protein